MAVDITLQQEIQSPTINRREFLTYAWGAALAVLAAEAAATSYFFLYPRFRVGEFGGKFRLGSVDALPATNDAPQPNTDGKFWLVNTEDGVKAIYMVCTHLGCLYKWEASENRFKCPCHASQFTRTGDYIKGPAPRSLDQFVVEAIENGEVVSTTIESAEGIEPPAIRSATTQFVVDTGKRIVGQPKELSPAREQST
ncbi:MAG: Rieske 2Fe-2S domain-containing protein [Caldilineaceae bacterium]